MALGARVQEIVDSGEFPLLTIHSSWQRVLLTDISTIQNGFPFPSDKFTKGVGMPLIRIRDIGNPYTQDYFNGEFDDEYIVNKGDVLIGMDGDFKLSRWNGNQGLLNQRVCRIILQSSYYSEQFLILVLPSFLDAIHSKTSSVTVKHLSSRTIQEIPLPLPPLAEQQRIVAKIEELFGGLESTLEGINKTVGLNLSLSSCGGQLGALRQSILKNAFEGKLVPQDPNDEPASVLLERIKAERAASKPIKKTRKSKE